MEGDPVLMAYNSNSRRSKTMMLAILGVLCALAYVVLLFVRIPAVMFLKYEPKDVIITIAGFLFGPLASIAVSVVVSLIEMVTISDTQIIGFVMNVLSSVSFAGTAAVIYKHKRTLGGAVAGLAVGTIAMVIIMLLWNYLITPLYMHVPRSDVAGMLFPVFLPFNLVKGLLNAAITLLIYKPVVRGLTRAHLIESNHSGTRPSKGSVIAVILVSLFIIATGTLVILAWQGII